MKTIKQAAQTLEDLCVTVQGFCKPRSIPDKVLYGWWECAYALETWTCLFSPLSIPFHHIFDYDSSQLRELERAEVFISLIPQWKLTNLDVL